MIDSHLHIDAESYAEAPGGVDALLQRALSVGVTRVVAPALNLESYQTLVDLKSHHPSQIYPAVGVHPHEATPERCCGLEHSLEQALQRSEFPILGETGLEGHYDFVPMDVQLESLRAHLNVARSHQVPIILHCRQTEDLLYQELANAKLEKAGVVHCFTGTWEWAQRFLDLGYCLGITGVVTFKNSLDVQNVARLIPADRLLVETDGPYLAPIPFRGKTNSPEYLPLIIKKISELRNTETQQIVDSTVSNTERLFSLPQLKKENPV